MKDKYKHKFLEDTADDWYPFEPIVKPTKPPSKRKIFNDEMRIKIQDQFPGLSPEKMKQKLAELWKIHMDELFAWKPM
jgi:hypothetical protein